MTLPEAPKVPIDRISLGTGRWVILIYRRPATFAAACSEMAAKLDPEPARENAKRVMRVAQAAGYMNGRELITAIDILSTWEGAEPAAKMAIVVALAECGRGGPIDDDAARVLSAKRWQ